MHLTDTRIRAAKPAAKPYKLTDGRGLYLEVRPTGVRLWRYRYRIGPKENVYAIGSYPDTSLAGAREALRLARDLVATGVHPAHHRKGEKLRATYENANTFQAVAREWLEAHRAHWTSRTYRQRVLLLEKNVFPTLGSLPFRQVTSAHAHQVVIRIAARAPQMAAIARQAFSAISALAIATMRSDADLGYPLRHSVKLKPTTHKKALRPNQVLGFFKALETYPGYFPTKATIRLLWLTLVRSIEAIGAKWAEFDLDDAVWTIPAERMKMRQPHIVPLPTQAVELLRFWRPVTGASEYLLPSRGRPKRHGSQGILIKAFESIDYMGLTPHAVRVTGRTILGEQGHPEELLELQLAHRKKKIIRTYDQGDRLEARRPIMQQWADYLDSLIAGTNVVNLHAKSS